jgi:phosphoribosyl 1,2-cyclic phosphodiesterase
MTEFLLRVNGTQPAFGIEFGLDSPRANEGRANNPYRQANVSYSLIQRQEGRIVRHTLIDCGMGVVPSLLDFEHSHGIHIVHEVLLTHPHFDHFAQLDWLSMCVVRSGRTDQPRPLPIYASRECWESENGPKRVHCYLSDRSDFQPLQPGNPVALGDITITPFTVNHRDTAPGALGFVVQHGQRKVVISGDFYRIPDEDDPLLFDADVAFLDANTWHTVEGVWHQSVLGNLRLIEKWRPRRAYLIHYSGYEDRSHHTDRVNGPMDMERCREEIRQIAGGRDIQMARHGMILGETESWPE